MPDTTSVKFNEIDESFVPGSVNSGICAVIGVTKRGEINKPSVVITSEAMFHKLFGGLDANNDFPLLCIRAIQRGAALRVCNVRHYTDISAGTLAATLATQADSALLDFSIDLAAGHTMEATINGTSVTQAFSISHENTLNLFAAKVKATTALAAIVEDCLSLQNGTFIIIPKAGVALVVTSTPTGAGAPVVTVEVSGEFEDTNNNNLFSFTPKAEGIGYNDLRIDLRPAASGDTDAFDLSVYIIGEPTSLEEYPGLKIIGNPTVAQSTYLQKIAQESFLINPVYNNLSALSGQIVPRPFSLRFEAASDGGAVVDTDYIGSANSKTGLYSFDGYDDFYNIAIPNVSSVAVAQGGSAYCELRKDCVFFHYLGNYSTEAQLITARDNTLVDSTYIHFIGGSITIVNPIDSTDKDISSVGDALGAAAFTEINYGPWISHLGKKKGRVFNAKAVTNNFGGVGNFTNLNLIANRQISLVVNESGVIFFKGNFTGQKDTSSLSYLSIRKTLIYIKKALGPVLERYIEEPNDPDTWKQAWMAGSPILQLLEDKRGLYKNGWSWQGDQFAADDTQLVVNLPADIQLGKYKIKLYVKPINSLQQISIDVIITRSGVSFEDNLSTIINN